MKTLKFLLKKEFRQIFRNPTILKLVMLVPVIQLLILPLAADFEIKNILIAVVDQDQSSYSRRLVSKVAAGGYFKVVDHGTSFPEAFQLLERDQADLILEIPRGFERNLIREESEQLYVAINAINGAKANVGGVYLRNIVSDFNQDIRTELVMPRRFQAAPAIEVAAINRFNPLLNYRYFMVPGILAFLVTLVGTYICSLNLVKEKETGTIEQVNVTPIRKHHFILGKLIPFWVIGMFIFSVGLFLIAGPVYGITAAGSIGLLYAYLGLYLVAVLGIGLLISTYARTQQQAMSLAFFFIMIFLLMSGLFTPIEGMPEWAKWITRLNPVTYFIEVMRMVIMKGSGFRELINHFLVMAGFAVFFNSWAVLNYKKTG